MTYLEITQANSCQDGWEWREGECRPTYGTLEKLLSQERKLRDEIIGELAEQEREIERLIGRVKYLEEWLETEFCFSCDDDSPVFGDDLELDTTKL